MNEILKLLGNAAPALATALAGPIGGAAISAISNKLGVSESVEAIATEIAGNPQALEKIKELELEFAKVQVEQTKADTENTQGARSMQTAALASGDKFVARFVYWLAIGWSVFAILYIVGITFFPIPESNVRFADTILGFLLGTVVATILNFFFGSSKSSKDKDEMMKAHK